MRILLIVNITNLFFQRINMPTIHIPDVLDSNSIQNLVRELNYVQKGDELTMDFTNTNYVYPGGITPLFVYLMHLQGLVKGKIICSQNSSVNYYLEKMDFFKCLGIKSKYKQQNKHIKGSFLEAFQFSKFTDDKLVIEKTEQVMCIYKNNCTNPYYRKAINWCIPELVDNAYTHSDSHICLLSAQSYSTFTEFCVADYGIGFKQSMGINNVRNAIKIATGKENKGINSEGKGMGLYGSFELIKQDSCSNNSSISIFSDNVFVELSSGGQI